MSSRFDGRLEAYAAGRLADAPKRLGGEHARPMPYPTRRDVPRRTHRAGLKAAIGVELMRLECARLALDTTIAELREAQRLRVS